MTTRYGRLKITNSVLNCFTLGFYPFPLHLFWSNFPYSAGGHSIFINVNSSSPNFNFSIFEITPFKATEYRQHSIILSES